MIKVLHILKSIDIGGIETLVLDCCNSAHHFEIETHVLAIGGDGELGHEFRKSKAKFSFLNKIKFPNDIIDPTLVLKLRRYIINNKIDVVHCHFADEGLHGALSILGLRNRLLVQSYHVDFKRVRWIDFIKFKIIDRFSNLNIPCSNQLAKQLSDKKIGKPGKNQSAYNGINPERILATKKGSLKKELKLEQDSILAGMVGNFYNDIRDQATVCRALAIAVKKQPGFHFVFAGGFENQWIKKGSSNYQDCYNICSEAGILGNVHFLGLRYDTANIFASLDFYVHATNFDTFGMAPVEAMMNKLPVVGNDAGVFKEVSNQGEGMILFKDKDASDLAGKMHQLIIDSALRENTGLLHFEFAMRNYHINEHLKKMKETYLSLL